MDDLRLVLLSAGVLLVALIWLWGRRRARKEEWDLEHDADLTGERVLPDETKPEDEWEIIPLRAARGAGVDDGALEQMRGLSRQSEELDDIPTLTDVVGTARPQKPLPDIVVAVTLIAKPDLRIKGTNLVDAARKAGLSYGTHRIFHHMSDGKVMFSMANILEPGHFELDQMDRFTTPGVALFMRLPGNHPGFQAVNKMIDTARFLAKQLDVRICDERRTPLGEQGITRLLEKARPYKPVSGS